jgi:hypothetical protein
VDYSWQGAKHLITAARLVHAVLVAMLLYIVGKAAVPGTLAVSAIADPLEKV